MALAQVNLRIEQGLLAQMKAEAKQRGLSLNSLAASAFERLLAGEKAAEASSTKLDGLANVVRRLEVLEQKLARQEHHLPHGTPAKPAAGKPAPAAPTAAPPLEPKQMAQLGDGTLSSAELAIATTTNRAAWNNWASDERVGQVRDHATAGQWRLMGKAPAPSGGPDRWMWQKI